MNVRSQQPETVRTVALVGNPNSGKTTLFNALTGLHHRVGNYPGVTVEKKEGALVLYDALEVRLIDLPGTYSMHANSPDEKLATEILLGLSKHTPAPDIAVCTVDATNLERNLYLVTQLIDRHVPLVVALTMVDCARQHGITVDTAALSRALGCPVVPVVAHRGEGLDALRAALSNPVRRNGHGPAWRLPESLQKEWLRVQDQLRDQYHQPLSVASHEAIELLTAPDPATLNGGTYDSAFVEQLRRNIEKLDFLGIDRQSAFIEGRYAKIGQICRAAVSAKGDGGRRLSDRKAVSKCSCGRATE